MASVTQTTLMSPVAQTALPAGCVYAGNTIVFTAVTSAKIPTPQAITSVELQSSSSVIVDGKTIFNAAGYYPDAKLRVVDSLVLNGSGVLFLDRR